MTTTINDYKLDGIYAQRQEGYFMQRVKLPAGVISASQARTVAEVSEQFAKAKLHLTTRGSIEIHWLQEKYLPEVKRRLATAGLTSRGACGGAVRGITCGSQGAIGFTQLEAMARRIHRHFTANPRFERLPKKFKVGIEADTKGKRHLIQDFGLVLNRLEDRCALYDVWVAGGLGREPQPAILLESEVHEDRIIPLIEAVARVYEDGTAPGKRLKHLLNKIGEAEFRRLIYAEPTAIELLPPVKGFAETLTAKDCNPAQRIEAYLFAGQLTAAELEQLADFSDKWSDGTLMLTTDQNVAFQISTDRDRIEACQTLQEAGFVAADPAEQVRFRVCPGSHECKMGLSPTREIAAALIASLGEKITSAAWALSGCHNSCSQSQLADIGITTSSLTANADGQRTPRFDIFRGQTDGLGQKAETGLTFEELTATICR